MVLREPAPRSAYDIGVQPESFLGDVLKRGHPPSPPSLSELHAAGLIAPAEDPGRWFSRTEQPTADWLRSRGLRLTSVRRREGQHLKTPDAAAIAEGVTVELKGSAPTTNAIVQRVRTGRKQSRRVVVDLRNSGVTRATAQAGLQLAIGMYGEHLDEVALIVSDEFALGWTRG